MKKNHNYLHKIILLIYWLLSSVIFAQEEYILTNIKFEGNENFSPKILKEQIILRSQSNIRNLLFWKKPYQFWETILQRDINRLKRFYQREGFLGVNITNVLEKDDNNKKVSILIKISEGKPIIINSIHYELTCIDDEEKKIADTILEKISPLLILKSGKRFRDQDAKADQEIISRIFSNSGFPFTQTNIVTKLALNSHSVDLILNIDTGSRCVFGEVEIVGNKKTSSALIYKRFAFKKGQIFNQELVQKTQKQIYQLGVFQYVTIKVLMEGNRIILPVQIIIKEAPRLTTKFGIGYGKEDSFRAFTDLHRLAFLGDIRRLRLFAKHSGLEPYNFNIKFTQPAFITTQTSFILNPFFKREKEPAFTVDRQGSSFSLQHRLSTYTDSYLSYSLERDYLKKGSLTDEDTPNKIPKLYNKSSINLGVVRDSSYPTFAPNKGMFNAVSITLSGIGFNSEFHFIRTLLELRQYLKLAENWVLAYRFKLGEMKPLGQSKLIPIEERFYAGGSNSIRGWVRSQLGPKNELSQPIGGNSYFENSEELRFPIWKKISGVYFVDIGNVWQKSLDVDLSELHYATGFGLRFKTPIGPIRCDVAVPIFEGKQLPQFHISVGQSF